MCPQEREKEVFKAVLGIKNGVLLPPGLASYHSFLWAISWEVITACS